MKAPVTCEFCKYFENYVLSKKYVGKGFGECTNSKVVNSAFYSKDGTKLKFFVANYFGCIDFQRRKGA